MPPKASPRIKKAGPTHDEENPSKPDRLTRSSSLSSLFSLGKKRKRSDINDREHTPNTPRTSISSIWMSPSRSRSSTAPNSINSKHKKRSLFSLARPDDDSDMQKQKPKSKRKSRINQENSDYDNDNDNDDNEHDHKDDRDESNESRSDSDSDDESHPSKKRRTISEAEELREKELDELVEPQYRKYRPRGYTFNPPPKDRSIRIYADGVFDLFHLGHMKQLEQAKKALPNVTLICGVPSDVDTHKHKGLTVLSDVQRCETLTHCKWVDEVIPDAPWCVTVDFLKKHHIDYVAHDDLPYASGGNDDIYRPVKELGMFLTTQRTEGISTSDIITKIIRDYDKYLMRNFARGASRKDLNVSWLKKNELNLKRHVLEFRESFKTNFESTTRDIYSEFMGYISGALHLKDAAAEGRALSNSNGNSANTTLHESPNEDSEAPGSPATDFASGYSGGSFFGNVKDWVSRRIDSSIPPSPTDTPRVHSDEE